MGVLVALLQSHITLALSCATQAQPKRDAAYAASACAAWLIVYTSVLPCLSSALGAGRVPGVPYLFLIYWIPYLFAFSRCLTTCLSSLLSSIVFPIVVHYLFLLPISP